jgi:hypothetical protein
VNEGAFSLLVDETMAFESIGDNGKIELVHNLIESVDFESQTVFVTGRAIKYSILIVATGLQQPEVFSFGNRLSSKSSREDLLKSVDSFKESVYSSAEIERRLKKQRKQISNSENGAFVIGNSKSAVELAATLKETQGSGYRVTLVTTEGRLVPELSEQDAQKLLAQLRARGVVVRLNCTAPYDEASAAGAIVLDCMGDRRPNSEFLLASSACNEDGFVVCDDKLRIRGGLGIEFAVGTLLSGGPRKGDSSVVAKNVLALLNGKPVSVSRGQKAPKQQKVASVALGSEEFFSVGLMGKIETKRRVAVRHEVAVGL